MTQTLFAHSPALATSDLDEARLEVGRRFCPHRLEVLDRGATLDLVHNAGGIGGDVSVNYLRYGAEVRIVPGTFDSFFLVQIPLAGRALVTVGDRVVHSDRHRGSIGSPTEPVDMTWSADCEQLLVYIRRGALEGLTDVDEPVVFDPALDMNAPAVRDWMQLVRLAADAVEAGSTLLSSSLAAQRLEETIVAALLAAQPSTAHPAPTVAPTSSRTLRRAMDLIEAAPERAWRVADLAADVGVSARALQDVFAREAGVSPLQHVRQVRLDRVRRDLLGGGAADSVTDIAYRWGFFHLSRFAGAYQQAFGELPSQTLRRRSDGNADAGR